MLKRRGSRYTSIGGPASPVSDTVINVALLTFNTTGAGLVSGGVPLIEGQLTDADFNANKVALWVGGVEKQIYTAALKGRYPDGSIRSVLVQCQHTIPDSNQIAGELRIGTVRATVDLTVSEVSDTVVLAGRMIIPTDVSHLCACNVTFWPLLPAASEDVASAALLTTEFDSWYESIKNTDLTSGWYQSTYESSRALFAGWQRTGNTKYLWNGLQRVYYLNKNYTLSNPGANWYSPNPNPNNWPGVNTYALPGEPHSQRYVGYASAYLLTGAEEFHEPIAIANHWKSYPHDTQAKAIATNGSGYIHNAYPGRYNLIGAWPLALATLVDNTKVYRSIAGGWQGRVMNYQNQVQWLLDAFDNNRYTTGWWAGIRGSHPNARDDTTTTAGEFPHYMLALCNSFFIFIYLNVKASATLAGWIKTNTDLMLSDTQLLQSGDPDFGVATYGYCYLFNDAGAGVRQGQVQCYTLPMWIDSLAFCHAYYGGNAPDGVAYLTWYNRFADRENIRTTIAKNWKNFGESFGSGMVGPYLIANGLPNGLPSVVRDPVQY